MMFPHAPPRSYDEGFNAPGGAPQTQSNSLDTRSFMCCALHDITYVRTYERIKARGLKYGGVQLRTYVKVSTADDNDVEIYVRT